LPTLRKRAPFTQKRSRISLGGTFDQRIDVGNKRRRKHSTVLLPAYAESRECEKLSLNRSLISKVYLAIENALAELIVLIFKSEKHRSADEEELSEVGQPDIWFARHSYGVGLGHLRLGQPEKERTPEISVHLKRRSTNGSSVLMDLYAHKNQ